MQVSEPLAHESETRNRAVHPSSDPDNRQALILIAEDTKDVREVMRHAMERDGFAVVEAINGEQALTVFAEAQPDVVLLDAMMPRMGGIEACERIKAMPGGDSTPVLIVTSLDDDQTIAKAFEAGATEYITKPIPFKTLRHRIQHLLRVRRAEQRLAQRNMMLEQINKVAKAAASSLDLNQLLQEVVVLAGQSINATSAYICDYDAEADTTTVIVDYIAPEATPKESESDLGITYPLGKTFHSTGKWLKNPTPVRVVQVAQDDLAEDERAHYEAFDAKTALYIPIFTNSKLFGYLEFWESRHERHFSQSEIEMLQSIANQISPSLENAQLYTVLKQSEAALRQHTEDLEARNRELDAYSHTIAHDLKTPLHMVLNYASFVSDQEAQNISDESRDFLDRVMQFSINMTIMIDQLLLLANSRDATEISEPVEMEPVIDQVLEACATLLNEHDVKVTVEPPLVPVMGHSTWVYEILQNLVSNAAKYIGDDNHDPRIEITSREEDGRAVYIIKDNGVGISPENQERLFEMFSRFDKEQAEGFGLGMSIVSRLVGKMDGSIRVESKRGAGSTFMVSLPMPTE